MAAKRLPPMARVEDDDQPKDKRMRPMPSFASVISEVMMARSAQRLFDSLEPMLRRVVTEEVESGIQRTIRTMTRSPSLRIHAPEPPCLKLIFSNLHLPTIFTCNKILDINQEPLKLFLVEKMGDQITPKILPYPLKVEIVVIDGDFPSTDRDTWTVDEFDRNIKKERSGRRPLITKDVNYTIRNESCVTLGELEFTDNSSWVRSRRFKLGARVVGETSHGDRILEALTEAFIVKDQRGELYKKHYPPMLEDEVWRLEKIGKDGKFHKRLEQAGIKTVQDFLKLSAVNPTELKKMLRGDGNTEMSEKMWETILKHARNCMVGNKLYISRGSTYTIALDATCMIVSININGQIYSASDLRTCPKAQKDVIDDLVKNAYDNWGSLEEVERPTSNESLEHFQGNNNAIECNNHQQYMMPYEIEVGGIIEVDGGNIINNNDLQIEVGDWVEARQLFL